MTTVLVTAFEPFGGWTENSSRLCVLELKKRTDLHIDLTTRIYPVSFSKLRRCLAEDILQDFDFAIHLGQHESATCVTFETIGLNVMQELDRGGKYERRTITRNGPLALMSDLPLERWKILLKRHGIPSAISYHAGTYLCNAVFYRSLYYSEHRSLHTRSALIHLPLEKSQVAKSGKNQAFLELQTATDAMVLILNDLAEIKRSGKRKVSGTVSAED